MKKVNSKTPSYPLQNRIEGITTSVARRAASQEARNIVFELTKNDIEDPPP